MDHALTPARPSKAGITRRDIRDVVARFYATVRADPVLGPVFEQHIGTEEAVWQHHLTKIEGFWANVMLHARTYNGNPMQVHMGVPQADADTFRRWLEIFDETVFATLPANKAQTFSTLAHRIGRSLQLGLERVRDHGPPSLIG